MTRLSADTKLSPPIGTGVSTTCFERAYLFGLTRLFEISPSIICLNTRQKVEHYIVSSNCSAQPFNDSVESVGVLC